MTEKVLEGIRVVEMGTHMAVPNCARELGDLGAEVIKVEKPKGENYRYAMGLLFQLPNKPGGDYAYEPQNVNKKHVALNIKSEDGVKALEDLLATADVFLTNTREAKLDEMGLGFDTLRKKFPELVIGNVSGYGTEGPRAELPGYDASAFWAESGPLLEWTFKDDKHIFKPFYGWGDNICAGQLTIGILSALYRRVRTGEGDVVRVSLLGTGFWQNATGLMRYQAGHKFPKDFYEPIVPLDQFYKTKDGKWFLTSEEHWDLRCQAYFKLFNTPELADDPEWTTMRGYVTNVPEKSKWFEKHIAEVTSEEIEAALRPVDAVFCFITESDEVLDNEDGWANGYLQKHPMGNGTEVVIPGLPIRFESEGEYKPDYSKPVPLVGADTEEVFEGIGYSADKVAKLVEEGALVNKDPYAK
jgi:crotonobetainyl-CoA:carnitine CoA-transferase CaiB-like acyl-CoA transferase